MHTSDHSIAAGSGQGRPATGLPTPQYGGIDVDVVVTTDPEVVGLLDPLTAELALGGYAPGETFGYTLAQLADNGVHLVGARVDGPLVGVGGVELKGPDTAELKRFFVTPDHRGARIADAIIETLIADARAHGIARLRLETGDKQRAAMAFYERHDFITVPRFAPYVDSATSVCMERFLDVSSSGDRT